MEPLTIQKQPFLAALCAEGPSRNRSRGMPLRSFGTSYHCSMSFRDYEGAITISHLIDVVEAGHRLAIRPAAGEIGLAIERRVIGLVK